jgi:drug/metabolite transporter (DMT)-like permease
VVVSLGIAAIAHSGSAENKALPSRDKWILAVCILACLVFWGMFGIFDKLSQDYAKPLNGFLISSGVRGAMCIFIVPLLMRSQVSFADLKSRRMWSWTWSSASCLAIGNIGFVLALPLVPTGYLIVVTACYPLVMYLGAVLFLSEKVNWLRLAGIGVVIAGLAVAELGK